MSASGLTAAQQDILNRHQPVFANNKDIAASLATKADVDNGDAANGIVSVTKNIKEADLNAAALTQTIDIVGAALTNIIPIGVAIQLVTPFTGGGAGSCAVEVGDAGSVNRFATSLSVFATAGWKNSTPNSNIAGFWASLIPQIKFTANVNVVLLTAGELNVTFFYRQV